MIRFTRYADNKFDVLRKFRVFYTREMVEDAIGSPDKTGKKNGYLTAETDGMKVVYKKEGGGISVITFYPVKST